MCCWFVLCAVAVDVCCCLVTCLKHVYCCLLRSRLIVVGCFLGAGSLLMRVGVVVVFVVGQFVFIVEFVSFVCVMQSRCLLFVVLVCFVWFALCAVAVDVCGFSVFSNRFVVVCCVPV